MDDFQITTQRLILRPHKLEDANFMVLLNSDPEVMRYVGDAPLEGPNHAVPIIERLRKQFEERKIGRFIVIAKETNKRIGWCGLKFLEETQEVDLGYRFLREAWGKGYATEAAQACLQYGFKELHFDRIMAWAYPDNKGSISVLRKLGMNEFGRSIEDGHECIVFEISRDNYEEINN